MSEEQKAAYIIAQSSAALIEALGMVAENAFRQSNGNSIMYGEASFNAVINKYGIHHNSVLGLFHE